MVHLTAAARLTSVLLVAVLLALAWRPPASLRVPLAIAAIGVAVLNLLLVRAVGARAAASRREARALQRQTADEREAREMLEQRVRERTTELDDAQRVLHRTWWLGQQITLELDRQRVLDRFLEAVTDVSRGEGAALGLLTEEGHIEIAVASGTLAQLGGHRLPVASSALGHAVRTGRSWSVEDVLAQPDQVHQSWFAQEPVQRAMAVVPIQRRSERIGAVVVAAGAPRAFTALEIERIDAMADLLSVALANAELFETLRQAEWRFRTLFRAAPDAVLTVLHATGRIRDANDAVREVFGVEPPQLVGRCLVDLVRAEDRALLETTLAAAFAGTPARAEVQVVTGTGSSRVVALAASRLPEADPPSVLLVGRDTTHDHEMRRRLMEADRLAAVGELVAGVAHEVNNPLSSISAFAQLLLGDAQLSASQRESLEIIRAETQRASQVVKDLLAFARRSETERVPLDLNALVARTIRMQQYQFTESAVLVESDLADDLPSVVGDARQLQQVCLNLLTNAVQAMAPRGGGVLAVRTRRAEGSVQLEIQDSGGGIAPAVREHIFEPFFTTKPEGEGTGLGLSVSYGIVAAHGGTIDVVDTSSTGTTFRVSLPAAATADAERGGRISAPFSIRSPLAGLRILVVDDEPALRSGLEAFGSLRGFEVVTAADGPAALEVIRTQSVDAVVCDIRMPGMDGFAFVEHLRRERPGLADRTVLITGDVVATAIRGATSGQPVVPKPFSFDRIENALVAVLRGTPYESARTGEPS